MTTIKIGNSYSYYQQCMHYMRTSNKWIKSMRIANNILSMAFPEYRFVHCEAMFPSHDSKFILIKKLGVAIVCEVPTIHQNRIYFSFVNI